MSGFIPDDDAYVFTRFAPDAVVTVRPGAPVYIERDDGTREQIGTLIGGHVEADGLHVECNMDPILTPVRPASISFSAALTERLAEVLRIPLRLLVGRVPYKPSKRRYGR